jgi:hypothetical protein
VRCLFDLERQLPSVRGHGLMVRETAFEFLPLHTVTLLFPMAPETEVALLSGGLKTKTSTVPGARMSAAEIATTSWTTAVIPWPKKQGGSC